MLRSVYACRYWFPLLICSCFSHPAFSAEIVWTAHDRAVGTGSSPTAACTDLARQRSLGNEKWTLTSAQIVTTTHYKCLFDVTDVRYPSYKTTTDSPAYRSGDTCPSGQELNSATGLCETDCSDTVGESLLVRGQDSVVVNSNGTNYVASQAPESICVSSCGYAPASSFAAGCYLLAGSTDTGYCNYIVEGTGDSCSGFNLIPADTSGDPLNPSTDPTDPEDDPCHGVPGYEWNGTTCVKNDGGGDGEGDGSGDGSGDGDGDGDGDGSGDGSDGGGSDGSGGSGDGDGSSGGGGSGGGNGGGDCSGDDCGPGEGGGLSAPEKGNFDEAISYYEAEIEYTLSDIKDRSAQFSNLIIDKVDVNLSTGNASLPCFNASVLGKSLNICFSDYTNELSVMRNLLLFLAAVIALYIIFREDK